MRFCLKGWSKAEGEPQARATEREGEIRTATDVSRDMFNIQQLTSAIRNFSESFDLCG